MNRRPTPTRGTRIKDDITAHTSCREAFMTRQRPATSDHQTRGFALLVSLMLMSFIVLLMLSLSSIVQIDTRIATTITQEQRARANALLGLQTAIGELQRLAGPDTRITARADIYGVADNSPYRGWTGVWDSQDQDPDAAKVDHTQRRAYQAHNSGDKPAPLGWLASGLNGLAPEDLDPVNTTIPANDQVVLVSAVDTMNLPAVVAGKQSIGSNTTEASGTYAWWVGDEGIKARVNSGNPLLQGSLSMDDLAGPAFNTGTSKEKATMLATSMGLAPGVKHIGAPWQALTESELKQLSRAISYDSVKALFNTNSVTANNTLKAYSQDLTVYSKGLLTDVRKGGLKKDLTMAFENNTVFNDFFGVQPTAITYSKPEREEDKLLKGVMDFPVSGLDEAPAGFYLTPELQAVNKTYDVGPNWGTLYNYYNLYKLDSLASDGEMSPIVAYPQTRGPIDSPRAQPYKNYKENWYADEQQTNSPVTPILERFQLHLKVGAVKVEEEGEAPAEGEETPPAKYKLRFYLQPMFALWNPYNVKIKRAYSGADSVGFHPQYRLEFEAAPELEISGVFDDGTPFTETVNLANAYLKGEGDVGVGMPTYTQGYWSAQAPEDMDFMPGEIRILSAKSVAVSHPRDNQLDYGWQDSDGFYFDWPFEHSPTDYRDKYVANSIITIHSVRLKDRHDSWFPGKSVVPESKQSGAYWALIHETASDTNKNNSNLAMQGSSGLWKDPYYVDHYHPGSDDLTPGTIEDGSVPERTPEALASGSLDVGTWLFHLRTTNEPNGLRNLIDANPRALYAAPRWDGPALFSSGTYQAGGSEQNGYFKAGELQEPNIGEYARNTGLSGPSIEHGGRGQSHIVLFDVPRLPPVSIGQFQHANLSRYNFEPAYLVGNSYANPRIPLDHIVQTKFDGLGSVNIFDTAYMVNDQIFDEYFLSTVSPNLSDEDYQALVTGKTSPYNTRLDFTTPAGAARTDILNPSNAAAMNALGGRFMVDGAFNINSTSVTAWKAILSSMDQPFLRIDVNNTDASDLALTDPNGVYVSRTSLPLFEEGYTADSSDNDAFQAFFQGYRKLSDDELDALAEAMVNEVKGRGPFLSMSDFVNRRPEDDDTEHQRRGALQAALDSTVNQNIAGSIASNAQELSGTMYSKTLSDDHNDSQATGYNGYVLQGDLLQSLAPILTPRSDTFVIRAYGSSETLTGASGEAWCEAIVQRFTDMVATGNDLSADSLREFAAQSNELTDPVNQKFGRKFRIVAFRWLKKDEL